MITIQSSNVTVMVANMDVAVTFYTGILGLTLKNRYGDHWADIEGPGIAIGLHPAGKNAITGNNLSIGFKVKDIGQAVAVLESKGILCKLSDDNQVKLALFTDPDGNALYLAQTQW